MVWQASTNILCSESKSASLNLEFVRSIEISTHFNTLYFISSHDKSADFTLETIVLASFGILHWATFLAKSSLMCSMQALHWYACSEVENLVEPKVHGQNCWMAHFWTVCSYMEGSPYTMNIEYHQFCVRSWDIGCTVVFVLCTKFNMNYRTTAPWI